MNIIQTWKTKEIPVQYNKLIESVTQNNPKWNLLFFGDSDILEFIKTKMPEYSAFFFQLKNKIQQIDFFRYLAVYYYGGVYLDLDMLIQCPLDELYNTPEICKFPIEYQNITDNIITDQGFTHLIGNYAFYAPAKHPFLKKIIDNIINNRIDQENIKKAQSTNGDSDLDVEIYCTTGPIMVTQSYIDMLDKTQIELLSSTPFQEEHFGKYGKHYCFGSWKNK